MGLQEGRSPRVILCWSQSPGMSTAYVVILNVNSPFSGLFLSLNSHTVSFEGFLLRPLVAGHIVGTQ